MSLQFARPLQTSAQCAALREWPGIPATNPNSLPEASTETIIRGAAKEGNDGSM
jgi:hypothetical protein